MFWLTILSPGIIRDKTMDIKFIYIPNDDKQNYNISKKTQKELNKKEENEAKGKRTVKIV